MSKTDPAHALNKRRIRVPGKQGRWRDNPYYLVTEPAESGAGDEVIVSVAGHVSHAMLSRCSQVRMEAKRRARGECATRKLNQG